MSIPTASGERWPAQLAYFAALLFTLASGGTNLIYGISKGSDAASSAIWGAVSVAVSIVFALAWPALAHTLDRRQWSRAVMALAALLLTGAYSVSAALGSASGGRTNAAIEEKDIADQRDRAQAAYDAAKAELATLAPTRPIAELQALIDGVKMNPRSAGCAAVNGSLKMHCPKLTQWNAEKGRAERRAKLATDMDSARRELGEVRLARQANSDAVALAAYLSAIGLRTDPDTLNKILVLLAVLTIECGGGLALALAFSLSAPFEAEAAPEVGVAGAASAAQEGAEHPPAARQPPMLPRLPTAFRAARRRSNRRAVGDGEALRRLRAAASDGRLEATQDQIGRIVGMTKVSAHRALHRLKEAGRISLATSRRGTQVRVL